MPILLSIDVPAVVAYVGGLKLVRPFGQPQYSFAASSEEAAFGTLRRHFSSESQKIVGMDVVAAAVLAPIEKHRISIEFKPPHDRIDAWRESVTLSIEYFSWNRGLSMRMIYIPALDLSVLAVAQEDLDNLVQDQVRSAVRRRKLWSLRELTQLILVNDLQLRSHTMQLPLQTAIERNRQNDEQPRQNAPTLRTVATHLKRTSLRAAYEREDVVRELGDLLSASPPRSVLLVGASGVGKTAIFHEWVRRRGEACIGGGRLATRVCWATDGSRLISGQTGYGMWQQRCLRMANEARQQHAIVHLGNLVELCESGRNDGSGGCASLLAPRLADGSLQGVLECTPEQLTRITRLEPRAIAALTVLRIEEPSAAAVRSILLEAATTWKPQDVSARIRMDREKKRRRRNDIDRSTRRPKTEKPVTADELPTVTPEALVQLDRLHRRFRTDAAAPGRPLAFFHGVMSELSAGETLDAARVIEAFGRQTGLPRFLIDDAVRPDLARIEQDLRTQILGQDEVIHTLVDLIATIAADLSRGDRPLASMVLIGPTGVGKTETAKALARLIYRDVSRLVRIDMSEFSTPASAGRLIGDSFHEEGVLTAAVRAQPFSLLLLDEFEKAHSSVFDLLLQVLGEGRLSDGRGRLADFRNSIVMMTSNLGVESFRAVPLGLADTQTDDRYRNHFERQVRDFLRPEMFNRIDRILHYSPLSEATIRQITEIRLNELSRRDGWRRHSGAIQFDDPDVVPYLANKGYQPQYGARPLARQVGRDVVVPLAEAICEHGRRFDLQASVRLNKDNAKDASIVVDVVRKESQRSINHLLLASLESFSELRRKSQALSRSHLMRRLRNHHTLLERQLKSKLRTPQGRAHRDQLRYGPLGQDCRRTKERLDSVDQLSSEIEQAETHWWARYYRGESLDFLLAEKNAATLKERLWVTLCDLQSAFVGETSRITIVLSGPNFEPAKVLLRAYRQMAKEENWNFQAHALLRRAGSQEGDQRITTDGWAESPAFRVMTESETRQAEALRQLEAFEVRSVVQFSETRNMFSRSSLAAYRLMKADALTRAPEDTLALMLTFRGTHAAMLMNGEAGIHSFKRSSSSGDQCALLAQVDTSMPVQYIAPDWLPKRDFQLTGHPRRAYDLEQDLAQELTRRPDRQVKMDRLGTWLRPLILSETERRVWSELQEE